MAKVFITASLPGRAIELLQRAGVKVTVHAAAERPSQAQLLQVLKEYDGVITLLK